jgi:hypothetical protein
MVAEAGPLVTSTCSKLNESREYPPKSRTPSMKMSVRALNPRMVI